MKGSLMLEVSGTIPEGTDYIYVVKTVRKTFLSLQHFPIGPVVFGSYSLCCCYVWTKVLFFCLNKRCLSLQSFDQSKILCFVWSDFSFWKKRKENFREFNPLWSIKRLIFYSKKPKKFLRIRFYILSLNNDPKMEKNTNLYNKCKVH